MEEIGLSDKPDQTSSSFDPDNVYAALTYQGKRTEIKISPHAVSLASPVWRKALRFPTLSAAQDDKPQHPAGPLECSELEPAHKKLEFDSKGIDEFELVGDRLLLSRTRYQRSVCANVETNHRLQDSRSD